MRITVYDGAGVVGGNNIMLEADGAPLLHGQAWLRPLEGLDLAFLVYTQDQVAS